MARPKDGMEIGSLKIGWGSVFMWCPWYLISMLTVSYMLRICVPSSDVLSYELTTLSPSRFAEIVFSQDGDTDDDDGVATDDDIDVEVEVEPSNATPSSAPSTVVAAAATAPRVSPKMKRRKRSNDERLFPHHDQSSEEEVDSVIVV